MSSAQDDDFLPEDEMMEELPEDGFLPEEEGTETLEGSEETQAADYSETSEISEEETPEFSQEGEKDEEPEKDKPIEYRPPRMDLYTMLLVLSLIFVSLAAVIHWLEVPPSQYGTTPWKEGSPLVNTPNNR